MGKKKNKTKENILLNESLWDKLGIWKPSCKSVATMSFLTLVFWCLTRIDSICGFQIGSLNEYSEINLLNIHIGIGAVLIPLALFTANSMLSGKFERSEVLLDESLFFPLVIFEVLTFVLFLGSPNILILIPIFIIILSTIISFTKTINILLYPEQLEKKEKNLLIKKARSEFIKKLDQEVNFRKKNNELLEARKEYSTLSTNPYTFMDGEGDVGTVTSHKKGLIVNIDLKKINLLDDYITKRRKAFQNINNQNDHVENEERKDERPTNPISKLKVVFGSMVTLGDVLYEINQDYFENINLSRIEKLIYSAIEIDENYDNDLASKYLRRLKDRCLYSIESEEIGELDKNLNIYIDILDSFYAYLSMYGGGFSEKQASEERSNFIGNLESLRWIHEDIVDIFEKGIDAKHRKIIRKTAYLPTRMMRKAIENKDHLIFQEFLIFPTILYKKALDLKAREGLASNSDFMIDGSWRYLKELSFCYIESERSNLSKENIEGYGVNILKAFQSLLKIAIDNHDVYSFGIFVSQTKELFDNLERKYRYDRDEKENIYKKLDSRRNQMIFGIASWLLFLRQRKSEDEALANMYDLVRIKLPQNLKEFSSLFNIVHDTYAENFWGWGHWETSLYQEKNFYTIKLFEKSEMLFAVHSLQLLGSKASDEIENIRLETSRDLALLVEGRSGSLIKTLDKIKNNPEDWNFVLDNDAIEKVEGFKQLLEKAQKDQKEKDAEKIRSTSISPEKVCSFKINFFKNYVNSVPISRLFKIYGAYSDKTDQANPDSDGIGVNKLFDKAVFFGKDIGWHVHYTGDDNAFDFGRSMSQGENKNIFEKFKSLSAEISQGDIDNFFVGNDPKDYIILTTNNAVWRLFEYGKENYIPKWRQDFPSGETYSNAEGALRVSEHDIPIFSFFISDTDKAEIYILNKNKLGLFTHWNPVDENNDSVEVLDIQIHTLEEGSSEASKILENPPEWLSKIGSKEKQSEYLQERLVIKILERFDYQASDDFEGAYIELE